MKEINDKKSALIAMSGGVDSSVAAYLMKEKGYRCMGTTMRLFEKGDSETGTCGSNKDIEDAAAVAEKIGIPYEALDFEMNFKEEIIEKFIRIYEAGGVPNPCVDCNRTMKFGKLLEFAEEKGLYHLVTGHYARVFYDEKKGRYMLRKAADLSKDQSYVLYTLSQEQLSHIEFPLGEMTKDETRKIAEKCGFSNAHRKDSQDICFVPDGDYVGFMERYRGKPYEDGDIVDESGKVLGTHHGAVRYTRGQRKGLGIAAEKPLYVLGKDMESNKVFVGDEAGLFSDTLYAEDVNWISVETPKEPLRVKAKTRYRQKEQWATVYPDGSDKIKLVFDEPQRAITIGQAVVFYDEDLVVGGGTISGI